MAIKLKHRWSVGHNYLAGITAGDWWRLLKDNHFQVDACYWHRAAFVTGLSLLNSVYARIERLHWAEEVEQTRITEPPIFVLGHWRSGTTHLHNLLAQDKRFAYANTYQVVNPHTFLTTEALHSRLFAGLLPDKRPMDDVALGFETPQEDEFAPCLMTLKSLYLGVSFPRREDDYARYLTFHGVAREEIEQWQAGLLWFMKKLTLKHRRPLLLKSPPHTARIRLLLEMFPNARFIHIHRHPYEVFRSFVHYYDTACWYTYLQRPCLGQVRERILRRYTAMYDAYFEDLALIPDGQFHELGYRDLERDPIGQVRDIYQGLGIRGFETCEHGLRRYLDSLGGYRKNRFDPLPEEWRGQVAERWQRGFQRWGYDA